MATVAQQLGPAQLFVVDSADMDLQEVLLDPSWSWDQDPLQLDALASGVDIVPGQTQQGAMDAEAFTGLLQQPVCEFEVKEEEEHRQSMFGVGPASATTSMTPSAQFDDEDEEEVADGKGATTRRRRRVRNQKQQELNRLAQQRYRQRKKQKAQDLALTVESLATQLQAHKLKDEEIAALKKSRNELQERCEKQQLMLQQATERIMAQERAISEHKALIEKQAAQLAAAQSEASSSTMQQHGTAALSAIAGSADPVMLHAVSAQLVSVLKEALAEVGMQAGPVATALQDSIVQHITRTLSSCWRDLRAHAGNLPQTTPSDKPIAAITVSCC